MVANKQQPCLSTRSARERRPKSTGTRSAKPRHARIEGALIIGTDATRCGKEPLGFGGRQDVEAHTGESNRQVVICDGGRVRNLVSGKLVNFTTDFSYSCGKMQL
jgi:hypothetical protein